MPRLIWVFAGRTVTLLVLSCHGSYDIRHGHLGLLCLLKQFIFLQMPWKILHLIIFCRKLTVIKICFWKKKILILFRTLQLRSELKEKMSPIKRICVFEHSVMTNFNCACPAIQRGQGSGFLSEGSSWLTACMSEQRRFWRDCADAQARLNLRCSHRR